MTEGEAVGQMLREQIALAKEEVASWPEWMKQVAYFDGGLTQQGKDEKS